MKRTFLLLIVLTATASFGQDSRPKTLIGNDPERISGFGGVLFSFNSIDGDLSTMTGGGGAVLFDNTFFIGGYGMGLTGNKEFEIGTDNYSTSFGHGGFWMGYNLKSTNLIHMVIDTKLGWGNITTKSNALAEGEIKDDVFVFNPQVYGEVNVSYWFKVNAGVGYQKTIGVDDDFFSSSDFDSPTFSISLLFGWFN